MNTTVLVKKKIRKKVMANWLVVERINEEEWPKFKDKHCHSCGRELKNKKAACLHFFFEEYLNVEFLCCSCAHSKAKENIAVLRVVIELTHRLKGEFMEPDENGVQEKEPEGNEIHLDVPKAEEPEVISVEAEKGVVEALSEMVEEAEETEGEETKSEEIAEGLEETSEEVKGEEAASGVDDDNLELEIAESSKEEPAEKE